MAGYTCHMIVFLVSATILGTVHGHGYLAEPPSRNSMWRFGFPVPEKNYDDMGLNCGGFALQWYMNDGQCGVCGDDFAGVRHHEAGGKYAPVNRPVTRCYNSETTSIDVSVRITAYHKGYFEFRLCVHNDLSTPVPQSCLDNGYLLTVAGSDVTRYDINVVQSDNYHVQLDLPAGVTCTQCVLQWKYNAGNNWGCEDGECREGLGPQEQFVNCADISILPDCAAGVTPQPNPNPEPDVPEPDEPEPDAPEPEAPTPAPTAGSKCWAIGPWEGDESMDDWCMANCFHVPPYCPESYCTCN